MSRIFICTRIRKAFSGHYDQVSLPSAGEGAVRVSLTTTQSLERVLSMCWLDHPHTPSSRYPSSLSPTPTLSTVIFSRCAVHCLIVFLPASSLRSSNDAHRPLEQGRVRGDTCSGAFFLFFFNITPTSPKKLLICSLDCSANT